MEAVKCGESPAFASSYTVGNIFSFFGHFFVFCLLFVFWSTLFLFPQRMSTMTTIVQRLGFIVKLPNHQMYTLVKLCTTCSELFLAWFHCEIRAGLQVATARSTAVSPNLLLLWRRQIRTTFYNLEPGLNIWIFCRYFVDLRIYVCVQNIKPCEFATQLEEEPWRQAKSKFKWTQGTHTPDTKTHFWEFFSRLLSA